MEVPKKKILPVSRNKANPTKRWQTSKEDNLLNQDDSIMDKAIERVEQEQNVFTSLNSTKPR